MSKKALKQEAPALPVVQAPAVQPQIALVNGVQHVALPTWQAPAATNAKHVMAQAAAGTLQRPLAGPLAGRLLAVGKPCKVRTGYNVQCMDAIMAELAKHGGKATAAQLAAVATADFVPYAVRRGWLAPVAA